MRRGQQPARSLLCCKAPVALGARWSAAGFQRQDGHRPAPSVARPSPFPHSIRIPHQQQDQGGTGVAILIRVRAQTTRLNESPPSDRGFRAKGRTQLQTYNRGAEIRASKIARTWVYRRMRVRQRPLESTVRKCRPNNDLSASWRALTANTALLICHTGCITCEKERTC